MRAYKLIIDKQTVEDTTKNPQALQVRFEFISYARFGAMNYEIEIRNLVPAYMSQERGLVGKSLQFYAGMHKGLPLANPNQYGLLFSGTIQRAIKIIEGVETKLILLVRSANTGDAGAVFNVKKGDSVSQVVQAGMASTGVEYRWDAGEIIAKEPNTFTAANLAAVAGFVKEYGVDMYSHRGVINFVRPETGDTTARIIEISAYDLIGQPVQTDTNQIVIQTVLRGDIAPYQKIKLPLVRINPNTGFSEISGLSQTGVYSITELRHVGDYRNMSAESWVTQMTVLRV